MPSDSVIHAVAGAAGGIFAMTVTYPLVSVSTRAQVETKKQDVSTVEAVRRIIARDGVAGLYDGLSSSLLGIAVTNGVYYWAFEESRAWVLRAKATAAKAATGQMTTGESMLASSVAGVITSTVTNPIWVINTRQTVRSTVEDGSTPLDPKKKKVTVKKLSFLQTLQHIVNTDGILALWRGLGPALILVINPVLQYTMFEALKNWLVARRVARSNATIIGNTSKGLADTPVLLPLGDWDYFILGALSKLFATGLTYPYLTVKSRMQSGQAAGKQYKSSWDGLQQIIKNEGGVAGLYRGITPKLSQSVLTAAFLFLSKEKFYQATKRALAGRVPVPVSA